MKNLLQKHGIKVVNNQIAKADVEKAINIIATAGKYDKPYKTVSSISNPILKAGDIIEVVGFVMLKGLDNGKRYKLDRCEGGGYYFTKEKGHTVIVGHTVADVDSMIELLQKNPNSKNGIRVLKQVKATTFYNFRVYLHTNPSPWSTFYDGHVDVVAEDASDAKENALKELTSRNGSFSGHNKSHFTITKVEKKGFSYNDGNEEDDY